jgi:hypothetical protein
MVLRGWYASHGSSWPRGVLAIASHLLQVQKLVAGVDMCNILEIA